MVCFKTQEQVSVNPGLVLSEQLSTATCPGEAVLKETGKLET